MSRTEQIEIERKYDVSDLAAVPDLRGVGPVVSAEKDEPVLLRAVYYDTAEQLLLAHRITLRRREGGHDAGWHVKLPGDGAGRREVHSPLGADADEEAPQAIRRLVEVILRGRPLHPVLVLETHRTALRLLDGDGGQLAELADDEVTATRPDAETPRSWREWEVELAPGVSKSDGEALFDAVGDALERAGVEASASKSKLARGLGAALPGTSGLGAPEPFIAEAGTASAFVLATVQGLVGELHALDVAAREGDPAGVHRFRTTIRRLRSVLRVYRGVVDPETAALLDDTLAGVGRAAGASRDLDVVESELDGALAAAPSGFVPHEAVGRLHAGFREAARESARDLERVLDDPAYFELLDRLDVLLATEPTGASALHVASKFAAVRVAKESKRARRRANGAAKTYLAEGGLDPAVVHATRKAVRRLRYALEAQKDAGLKGAVSPKAAHQLQDALGDVLDAGSAAERFVAAAETARWAGEDTFGYGVLATFATLRSSTSLARLPKLAEKL